LSGAGTYFNIGALLTVANGGGLTNNSPTTLAGDTTIGQFGVGGYMVMNQPIGGTGTLMLHAQAASSTHTKRYELYASNTYAGTTVLNTLYCSTDFHLRGDQRLPFTNTTLGADAGLGTSTLVLDLHGHNQTFGYTQLNGAGNKVLRSTGGFGTLTLDNGYGFGGLMSNGGKLIIDGGALATPGYLIVRDNGELLVTGGVLSVGLEILSGWSGSTGTVTVADQGQINCYVMRNGDGPGWGDEPSVLNIYSGGILRTAAIHAFGTGEVVASVINFDGGLLSDGFYGEWGNSYSNWIMTLTNLVVKAGGARIEANSALRGINQSLRHDPLLGAVPDGGLTKRGGGLLRLGAPNSYTGPTIVENGTLEFAVPGALPNASKLIQLAGGNCDALGLADSTLHVDAGRMLAGNGIIAGLLNVGANGVVQPGASLGIISVSSNVTFGAGATYNWEIGVDGNADTIVADGALLLPGGVNVVTVQVGVAGAPAVESNTFILCSAVGGVSGSPDCFYMDYGTTGIGGPEHPAISGNDVLVELYVPEPVLLGLLPLILALRRRA
jgi:autotransporter-associated beta strand protein